MLYDSSSALVQQLVLEKENSEFKPVKLRLKIDLVSYPGWAESLVNIYTIVQISNRLSLPAALVVLVCTY